MDLVGHRSQHVLQKFPNRLPVGRVHKVCDSELSGPVDSHEQIQLSCIGLNFRNVDVEEANGIALEALPFRLATVDLWQARNAMAMQLPMQS
ncbi:hypothetical protein [Pararhodobacter sp.]|uniref:hypothetical protein n=1 Tax=Pararhodobacter sp. TaxID=2127056 RepID=UPI003A599B69